MVSDRDYCVALKSHYVQNWGSELVEKRWNAGPVQELGPEFRVLQFPPRKDRNMWTYATVGMSSPTVVPATELHLFTSQADESQVELLTVVAHYHRTGARLDCDHTVNFGRPWQAGSTCEFGLLSLPYLDGPKLENLQIGDFPVRCLWLIPMTRAERDFKKQNGLQALEQRWESKQFNYLDPKRASVV